jgi:small subunit ribosomal protein S1
VESYKEREKSPKASGSSSSSSSSSSTTLGDLINWKRSESERD